MWDVFKVGSWAPLRSDLWGALLITLSIHSQLAACSGKTPVCLKDVSRAVNFTSFHESCQGSGILLFFFHSLLPSFHSNVASAFSQSSGLCNFHSACVSGRD